MPRLLLAALFQLLAFAALAEPRHGIAMHGEPQLPAGFAHLASVNPDAPKGGRLTLGMSGSFDSLNPLIIKGEIAAGVREYSIETLMARGPDEPFTLYGLVAESIETPEDRSSATFRIDPRARFSDGRPVTADDLIFSMELLRDKGRPNHRTYYKKIVRTERLSERAVRFDFGTGDREMPLIMGLMPVLAKHAIDPEKFESTTLTPLIGTGPYVISKVDPGRALVYTRNPDYWGRDLAVNRGRFNFGEIRFEYFRDGTALLDSFKLGQIDVRTEEDPARWAKDYDIPALREGRLIKDEIATGLPAGMTGLVFNTRRAVFADPRVREALILLFNFEWANKSFYYGLYQRTTSYFERSILSSSGKPADGREQELLSPFAGFVRPDVLDGSYRLPVNDSSGHNRTNARKALDLLADAGFVLERGKLIEKKTGAPFEFEILTTSGGQEQLLANFRGDLEKVGIRVRLRNVDSAQYQSRLKDYDYDMILFPWTSSLSPGNEQLFRWSSETAGQPGSYNYAGVRNPAADAMIKAMLEATTAGDFVSAVRALDRVLISGHYCIPLFHVPKQWVAHWARVRRPEKPPLFGYTLESWWIEETK